MSIRVVVVDDQEMVRAGIAALLGAQDGIEVVGEAADGAAALAEAARIVAAGEALLAPSVTRRLIGQVVSAGPAPSMAPRGTPELTPREREVLVLAVGRIPPCSGIPYRVEIGHALSWPRPRRTGGHPWRPPRPCPPADPRAPSCWPTSYPGRACATPSWSPGRRC